MPVQSHQPAATGQDSSVNFFIFVSIGGPRGSNFIVSSTSSNDRA